MPHCRVYLKEEAVSSASNAFPTYLQNICIPTLPTDLCLKSKDHLAEGYQVCSVKDIPIGVKFGPYEDAFNDCVEQDKKDFQFQVEKKGEKIMILDGNNEKQYSWLRYINYANSKEEQNLITFQHKSQVYYVTCKFIPANTELLVWHQHLVFKDGMSERIEDISGNNQFEEKTDIDGMKIILSKIAQTKQENTLNFMKIKYVASKNDDIHKIIIKSAKLLKFLDLNEKSTEFICTKFHKPIYNEVKTFVPEGRSIQSKYEKSRNDQIYKFKKTIKLYSFQNNDSNQKSHDFVKCGSQFRKHKKIKLNEVNQVNDFTKESDEYEKQLYDNRLNEHKTKYMAVKIKSKILYENNFIQNSVVIQRVRIHTGEKPYKCNICGKAFSQESNLAMHQRIHTEEKPYKCNICRMAFVGKSNLEMHQKIHIGEQSYKCNTCLKIFTHKRNLIDHERTHTREKPFKCNTCLKIFTRRRYLRLHEKVHTEKKP